MNNSPAFAARNAMAPKQQPADYAANDSNIQAMKRFADSAERSFNKQFPGISLTDSRINREAKELNQAAISQQRQRNQHGYNPNQGLGAVARGVMRQGVFTPSPSLPDLPAVATKPPRKQTGGGTFGINPATDTKSPFVNQTRTEQSRERYGLNADGSSQPLAGRRAAIAARNDLNDDQKDYYIGKATALDVNKGRLPRALAGPDAQQFLDADDQQRTERIARSNERQTRYDQVRQQQAQRIHQQQQNQFLENALTQAALGNTAPLRFFQSQMPQPQDLFEFAYGQQRLQQAAIDNAADRALRQQQWQAETELDRMALDQKERLAQQQLQAETQQARKDRRQQRQWRERQFQLDQQEIDRKYQPKPEEPKPDTRVTQIGAGRSRGEVATRRQQQEAASRLLAAGETGETLLDMPAPRVRKDTARAAVAQDWLARLDQTIPFTTHNDPFVDRQMLLDSMLLDGVTLNDLDTYRAELSRDLPATTQGPNDPANRLFRQAAMIDYLLEQ